MVVATEACCSCGAGPAAHATGSCRRAPRRRAQALTRRHEQHRHGGQRHEDGYSEVRQHAHACMLDSRWMGVEGGEGSGRSAKHAAAEGARCTHGAPTTPPAVARNRSMTRPRSPGRAARSMTRAVPTPIPLLHAGRQRRMRRAGSIQLLRGRVHTARARHCLYGQPAAGCPCCCGQPLSPSPATARRGTAPARTGGASRRPGRGGT